MKRWLFVACLLAASAHLARASATPMVKPPAGWRLDAEQAADIAKGAAATPPFSDRTATIAVEVYTPATPAKITLIVQRATSHEKRLDRPRASKGAIDDLHGIVARAKLSGGQPVEDAWTAAASNPELQLQAGLVWHDPVGGTREAAQIILAQDVPTLVSVTGECVSAAEVTPALFTACADALTTLDPGIDKASRIMIPAPAPLPDAGSGSGSGGAAVDLGSGSDDAAGSAADDGHRVPMAHLDDGSRISLPPMAIPQEPTSDRRPVFVGAGIALLAAAFYWNRRRREKFEPEATADAPDAADKKDEPDDR